jgi:muramoyltetrapeptide carboxypeptidase LdcA involved in peptidoglycan recycling
MMTYTAQAVKAFLFEDTQGLTVASSPEWSDAYIPWEVANQNIVRKLQPERRGYELLQGVGRITGHLLGGCIDVFPMCIGTAIWPSLEKWKGAILFFETSEDKPSPDFVKYMLRNLLAQGILEVINGIVVGKPQGEVHYDAYKDVLHSVVGVEAGRPELPILYNVNIGHAFPTGILPYGIQAAIHCDEKKLIILESATV